MASRTASPSSGQRAARKRCTCTRLPQARPRPAGSAATDHKPGPGNPANPAPGRKKLLGRTEARVFTAAAPAAQPQDQPRVRGHRLRRDDRRAAAALAAVGRHPRPRAQPGRHLPVPHRPDPGRPPERQIAPQADRHPLAHVHGRRHARILGVAQDVALARDQWQMCQETIHACPDLEEEWGGVRNVNGDEMFWAGGRPVHHQGRQRQGGPRRSPTTSSTSTNCASSATGKPGRAVSKTTRRPAEAARPGPCPTPGDDNSVVLNQLQDVAWPEPTRPCASSSGPRRTAASSTTSPRGRQANPGLGYTVSEAAIRSALATDPPNVFRTEVLCQRVDQLDGAIDLDRVEGCADATGSHGRAPRTASPRASTSHPTASTPSSRSPRRSPTAACASRSSRRGTSTEHGPRRTGRAARPDQAAGDSDGSPPVPPRPSRPSSGAGRAASSSPAARSARRARNWPT